MVKTKKPWHAHYPEEIPKSISYDEKPLHVYLQESVHRCEKMKALHFMGKEMTFSEVYTEAKKLANYMQSLGLKIGDCVAIMLSNCPQFYRITLGDLHA